MIKQPITLTIKVDHGNVALSFLNVSKDTTYRSMLPIPPPRPTNSSAFICELKKGVLKLHFIIASFEHFQVVLNIFLSK